jgi:radical SAM superfamily enzyme
VREKIYTVSQLVRNSSCWFPSKLLIAPEWGLKNYEVREKIIKRFRERGTWQGKLFTNKVSVI